MKNNANIALRERMKLLRIQKGMTQQELAILFNVTRPCVCYWEAGSRFPDCDTLVELSKLYDVSLDYLLGRSDKRAAQAESAALSNDESNYLDLSILNSENRSQLVAYYEYLIRAQNEAEQKE